MAAGPGQRISLNSSLESEIIVDEYGNADGASTTNDSPTRMYAASVSPPSNGHTQASQRPPSPGGPSVSVLSLSSADNNFLGISKGPAMQAQMFATYLRAFDFQGMDVLAALRALLEKTRLPSDPFEIERLLEAFAHRYAQCSSTLTAAQANTLATSILVLNTDLHSQYVTKKMTSAQFIKYISESTEDQIPKPLLKSIYASVKDKALPRPDPAPAPATASTTHTAAPSPAPASAPTATLAVPSPSTISITTTPAPSLPATPLSGQPQHDRDKRPAFATPASMRKGAPVGALRFFGATEPLAVSTRAGLVWKKDTFVGWNQKTSFGRRAWLNLFMDLRDALLIFHLPTDNHDGDLAIVNMYDALLLRHAFAQRVHHDKREHVFELVLASGRECLINCSSHEDLIGWIHAINRVAAEQSAKPLPAPVAAATAFQRPSLPESRTPDTPAEALLRWRAMLAKTTEDAEKHNQNPLTTAAWEAKRDYLKFEATRLTAYIAVLEGRPPASPATAIKDVSSPVPLRSPLPGTAAAAAAAGGDDIPRRYTDASAVGRYSVGPSAGTPAPAPEAIASTVPAVVVAGASPAASLHAPSQIPSPAAAAAVPVLGPLSPAATGTTTQPASAARPSSLQLPSASAGRNTQPSPDPSTHSGLSLGVPPRSPISPVSPRVLQLSSCIEKVSWV
eukprot:m.8165 g.8165  ORF g.8165 m.8165 type:complete len:679 (-) comp5183_c0_seq1:139-2175(-)